MLMAELAGWVISDKYVLLVHTASFLSSRPIFLGSQEQTLTRKVVFRGCYQSTTLQNDEWNVAMALNLVFAFLIRESK